MKKEQTEPFDFEDFEANAISKLMQGERLGGKDGVLTPLIRRFLERQWSLSWIIIYSIVEMEVIVKMGKGAREYGQNMAL